MSHHFYASGKEASLRGGHMPFSYDHTFNSVLEFLEKSIWHCRTQTSQLKLYLQNNDAAPWNDKTFAPFAGNRLAGFWHIGSDVQFFSSRSWAVRLSDSRTHFAHYVTFRLWHVSCVGLQHILASPEHGSGEGNLLITIPLPHLLPVSLLITELFGCWMLLILERLFGSGFCTSHDLRRVFL